MPLVLSFCLIHRLASGRIKEVVEVRPHRFMHHLEVRAADDIDDEVRIWLAAARADAAARMARSSRESRTKHSG